MPKELFVAAYIASLWRVNSIESSFMPRWSLLMFRLRLSATTFPRFLWILVRVPEKRPASNLDYPRDSVYNRRLDEVLLCLPFSFPRPTRRIVTSPSDPPKRSSHYRGLKINMFIVCTFWELWAKDLSYLRDGDCSLIVNTFRAESFSLRKKVLFLLITNNRHISLPVVS